MEDKDGDTPLSEALDNEEMVQLLLLYYHDNLTPLKKILTHRIRNKNIAYHLIMKAKLKSAILELLHYANVQNHNELLQEFHSNYLSNELEASTTFKTSHSNDNVFLYNQYQLKYSVSPIVSAIYANAEQSVSYWLSQTTKTEQQNDDESLIMIAAKKKHNSCI